jgi:hypothetical protein
MPMREMSPLPMLGVQASREQRPLLHRDEEARNGGPVNERELGARWLKKFQLDAPASFVYRIADSPVSRKPFDAFLLVDGRFTAVEFKVEGNKLEPHQRKALLDVKAAGGRALVVWFDKKGKLWKETEL